MPYRSLDYAGCVAIFSGEWPRNPRKNTERKALACSSACFRDYLFEGNDHETLQNDTGKKSFRIVQWIPWLFTRCQPRNPRKTRKININPCFPVCFRGWFPG